MKNNSIQNLLIESDENFIKLNDIINEIKNYNINEINNNIITINKIYQEKENEKLYLIDNIKNISAKIKINPQTNLTILENNIDNQKILKKK